MQCVAPSKSATFMNLARIEFIAIIFFLAAGVGPVAAQPASPYAGQERNDISALAPQDVNALLAGQGMGLAKAAELNGYPGPLHVIELAGPLSLTSEQLGSSRKLMDAHRGVRARLAPSSSPPSVHSIACSSSARRAPRRCWPPPSASVQSRRDCAPSI